VTLGRLFVYGTLRDAARVRRVVGRALPSRPAVLEGYRRVLDRSIGYPVVHPQAGSRVDGQLLAEVDADALAALDAYEGHRYRRVVVRVHTHDARAVTAYLYIPSTPRAPRGQTRGSTA